MYFSLGRCSLELAQRLSRVALASHAARRGTPFGVTNLSATQPSDTARATNGKISGYFFEAKLVHSDSLRGSSVKIGTIQRRLAWPLRKDDTHKSRSVNNCSYPDPCTDLHPDPCAEIASRNVRPQESKSLSRRATRYIC